MAQRLDDLNNRCQAYEVRIGMLEAEQGRQQRTMALQNLNIAKQELRLKSLEPTSNNAILVWEISNFTDKQQDAIQGSWKSFSSRYFYTSDHGFQMKVILYPNGYGTEEGTHLSIYIVIMKGKYDALLTWPFRQTISFILLNQNGGADITDTLRPDPTSISFLRPTEEMNIASGFPSFVLLTELMNPTNGYIKDDTIFIKIKVDTTGLVDPSTD